jgi:hypothetical protein
MLSLIGEAGASEVIWQFDNDILTPRGSMAIQRNLKRAWGITR